ncbi:UNVERIFIED_CONTAM: hypothetical protein H355_016131 [Colinus virginianus]|nr:hypothetical protein H355_016131 [Colinus virginianus]
MERWAGAAGGGWSSLWDGGWGRWPAWELLAACALIGAVGWLLRLLDARTGGRGPPQEDLSVPAPRGESRPDVVTMDAILSRLKQLSPDELREEVIRAGLKCGPITSTTRFIFEKKLAQFLLEQQRALEEEGSAWSEEAAGSSPSDGTHTAVKNATVNHSHHGSASEDADFGYCVGLNPPEEEAVMHVDCSAPACGAGYVGSQGSTQTASRDPPLYYGVCPVYDDILARNGCRYNVMHVAAKENQAAICQLLLDTLENPEFMRLMYPDDDDTMLKKRIRYIVDLYLNTPDKAGFDTPLHFACKFGNLDVVNVLTSHPAIVKNPRNKYDQTPAEVVCERSKNKSAELKEKLREYLKGRYYVPLLRAEDNSSAPVIGAPWSPDQTDDSPQAALPKYPGSPKDPVLSIRAFAGPMSPSKAEEFRRLWKTPPRERAGFFHHVRKSDLERGVERVGRELAHELGFPWVEYWEFLGCFVDLSSQEGLRKLEEYLSHREMSEKAQQGTGENETCNRYKTPQPSGKSKKCCNSVSVGAFLDEDDDDMSLEEIKNRQNAARNNSPAAVLKEPSINTIGDSECEILSMEHSRNIIETSAEPRHYEKGGSSSKNGFCNPVASERIIGDRKHVHDGEDCLVSPVCSLMSEFESLTFQPQADAGESNNISEKMRNERILPERTSQGRMPKGRQDKTCYAASLTSSSEPSVTGGPRETKLRTEHKMPSERERLSMESGIQTNEARQCQEPPSQKFLLKTSPTNDNSKKLFLLGERPSKLDSDVLAAVEAVQIDPQKYPAVYRWKHEVQSYSSSDRQRRDVQLEKPTAKPG